MKRLICLAGALLMFACVPASARQGHGDPIPPVGATYAGRVELPTISPAAAHLEYMVTGTNDHVFGDVFRVSPHSDGHSYSLKVSDGATGLEDPDVYFYPGGDAGPDASQCRLDAHQTGPGEETGTICPGSETVGWAIIVLRTGAHVSFTFSS